MTARLCRVKPSGLPPAFRTAFLAPAPCASRHYVIIALYLAYRMTKAAPIQASPSASPRFLPALLILFAGSGCAALIYEIVWYQLLQLVIGSTAVSLGVLLATFMGGLCLGSLALPRYLRPAAPSAGLCAPRDWDRRLRSAGPDGHAADRRNLHRGGGSRLPGDSAAPWYAPSACCRPRS